MRGDHRAPASADFVAHAPGRQSSQHVPSPTGPVPHGCHHWHLPACHSHCSSGGNDAGALVVTVGVGAGGVVVGGAAVAHAVARPSTPSRSALMASCYGKTTNSTRRFSSRPAAVAFGARGLADPRPITSRRLGSTPSFASAARTAIARAAPSASGSVVSV